MTRKELSRLTRALLPYMSSANASEASRILLGLEMDGDPADVEIIANMVAPHAELPHGLRATLDAARRPQ
jgi:hypothetical protein